MLLRDFSELSSSSKKNSGREDEQRTEGELELKQDDHQKADNISLKSSQEKKNPLDYASLSHIYDATAGNKGTQLLKITI